MDLIRASGVNFINILLFLPISFCQYPFAKKLLSQIVTRDKLHEELSYEKFVSKMLMKLFPVHLHTYAFIHTLEKARCLEVKVEHCLLFVFSPPRQFGKQKIFDYICLHLFTLFYLAQPSNKQIDCFYFDI
jgi:hypothetical protein